MKSSRVFALFCVLGLGTSLSTDARAGGGHGHHDEHDDHEEAPKGPHGGRLLEEADGFALEMTIYEPGIPPQSRVYAFQDEKPLDPASVKLTVEFHRLDGVDTVTYNPVGEFLLGDQVIREPHSFEVHVAASHEGKDYTFQYESFEGRVEIAPESARLSGIATEAAGPRTVTERLPVLGRVGFNEDAVRHVSVRYPGTLKWIGKQIGDTVRRGEAIAVVSGTETLTDFTVYAPGAGRVVEKRSTSGEVVHPDDVLLVIADLATVWVDFTVYRSDAGRVTPGQSVRIVSEREGEPLEGKIAYLSPVGDGPSQSLTARAFVPNPEGAFWPGLFVKGQIAIREVEAPVVVRREAVQTFRDWQVVFRNKDSTYEITIVELGLVDGDFVEVTSGLSPGDVYVAKNSFIVKADIGKAGVSHSH